MTLPELLRPRSAFGRRASDMPGLMRPLEDMQRLMEGFLMSPLEELGLRGEGFVPRVDITEEDNNVVVAAELPGLDQKDIDVTVTRDSLRIAGQKRHEEKQEETGYYRHEISCGSFDRIIDLPTEVDEEKAEAEFSKGVLKVKLPKNEAAKPKHKKIKVKNV